MLQKLSIKNYAIIDDLEISFSGQLNVITGETGAGKSIIVGALALILGQRADSSVLVNKEKKCFVEGFFEIKNKPQVQAFLIENECDVGEEVVIRREIGVNGKSRAYINDSPVTLTQLAAFSSLLVDLHQQFDTLELGQAEFQRSVLDALAGQFALLAKYQLLFEAWRSATKEWAILKDRKAQFEKEFDYTQFQYTELEEMQLRENELEDLDAELRLLNNAEGIKSALSKLYSDLKEGESPIVYQLRILANQLSAFSSFHPDLPPLLKRLQSSQIELQDIADETDHLANHVSYDPKKIDRINERLAMGYKLLKKHGVKTTGELLAIKEQLAEKLQAVLNIDDQLLANEKQANKLLEDTKQLAAKISAGRKKQVKPLEDRVNELLGRVGMPNARIKVELKTTPESLDQFGADTIEFYFDANKTGLLQPIRKVASGGELSRLMLCIKSLVVESIDLSTMIFDEIDTGISGEAARQVGIIMKELASKRQVICITHQPQIAGKADAHFFVYKETMSPGRLVKTNIRLLTTEERIVSIAKMLGGEKPTAAAMENAREMVMN